MNSLAWIGIIVWGLVVTAFGLVQAAPAGAQTGGLAPHFQIELYKAGRMDAMRVYVEADASGKDELSKTAAARMLTKRIKDIVGVSTEVIVGDEGSVERSQGKAKRVVDNRDKE